MASHAQNPVALPSYVPTNGLAGWWALDSNANDASVNANHGLASNVSYVPNRFNQSAKAGGFNGINSLIEIAEKPSLKVRRITMSAWVYTNVSRYSQIAYKGQLSDASNESYSFSNVALVHKTNSSCNAGQGWNGAYYPSVLPSYSWIHVCATSEGSTGKNYINGVLVSQGAVSGLIDTCSSNLRFGYAHNNGSTTSGVPGDAWDGKIDDIGLWNRALTEEEIYQLYTQSLVVPPPPAGIATESVQSAIRIWPNPAGEQINIEGAGLAGNTVQVANVMGQLVYSNKSTASLLKISTGQLGSTGLYFVKIISSKGEVLKTEKLLIR